MRRGWSLADTRRRVMVGAALLTPGGAQEDAPLATALNGDHVARPQRERTRVTAGDHITTFTPIVGG